MNMDVSARHVLRIRQERPIGLRQAPQTQLLLFHIIPRSAISCHRSRRKRRTPQDDDSIRAYCNRCLVEGIRVDMPLFICPFSPDRPSPLYVRIYALKRPCMRSVISPKPTHPMTVLGDVVRVATPCDKMVLDVMITALQSLCLAISMSYSKKGSCMQCVCWQSR